MSVNAYTNSNSSTNSFGRIDSRQLAPEELSDALDRLLATRKDSPVSLQFPQLVRLLDGVTKVNPHQHITGSVGHRDLLRRVIRIYQHDAAARAAFLEYVASQGMVENHALGRFFSQSPADLLRWMEAHIPLPGDPLDFEDADDRLGLVRLAFQSGGVESHSLLREAYRTVALENLAHGVTEVWFRTSLGDHESEAFLEAAGAALEGAGAVDSDAAIPISVRFLVGLRKRHPDDDGAGPAVLTDTRAEKLVEAVITLRDRTPGARAMITGIDSVGMDSCWLPEWQAPARRRALAQRLHVAVHLGESWLEGDLPDKLNMLWDLVAHGVIHQLDNANALFAVKDLTSRHQQYSNDEWVEIRRLQQANFQAMADRGIVLGINPTSNDLLTRSLRRREGWRFRALTEPLGLGHPAAADLMLSAGPGHRPLIVVVGNDNSRLYPSRVAGGFLTVSEELANLWDTPSSIHSSVYGKLSTTDIARIIRNGFILSQVANQGWFVDQPQNVYS